MQNAISNYLKLTLSTSIVMEQVPMTELAMLYETKHQDLNSLIGECSEELLLYQLVHQGSK